MRSIRRWVRSHGDPAAPSSAAARKAGLVALLPAGERDDDRVQVIWERLRACTHPRLYAAQLGPDERAAHPDGLDVDTAIDHYLARGARAGLRICAVFHPQWYADRLAERGMSVPEGTVPFLHWLSVGWEQRIVPTPLYDEGWYRERHPLVSQPWAFVQYVNHGLYERSRRPSPVGQHHAGAELPGARERHEPLLLAQMLHRAEDYDLSRTSWLEEGCLGALRAHASLETEPMRGLIEKAAAIEPLVQRPWDQRQAVTAPPHRAPRLYMAAKAEELRRGIGRTHVDTIVLVPDLDEATVTGPAGDLAEGLRGTDPGSVLLVATDGPPAGAVAGGAEDRLDVRPYLADFDDERRLDLLLDLVRGLAPRRIVTVESALGWELFTAYGRQLSARSSLGACVLPPKPNANGHLTGFAVKEIQDCFASLDWVLVTDAGLREDLVDRYLLPQTSQQRLLLAYASDGQPRAIEVAALKQIVADGRRREESHS